MAFWERIFNTWRSLSLSTSLASSAQPQGVGVATQGTVPLAALSDFEETRGTDPYVSFRETNDYVDLTAPMNRQQRYKEYDRLDNTVPEIASGLNIYADDASQQDENGHTFKIFAKNKAVLDELNFLFFQLLEIDDTIWGRFRNLCKYGDLILELVIDPSRPELGIQKIRDLPCETIWRLETVRGRLLEFQQSTFGPDYRVLSDQPHGGQNTPGTWQFQIQGMQEMARGPIIRFTPDQIIHVRIGYERKGFYPYGVSIIENAKGPAQSLKLMEDAMLVYRLTRAPERRVFYLDVGQTPPNRVEHFIERIKDKFKKRKIFNPVSGTVDERFNPLTQDEDFFVPVRPNTNTRIETLPGAQNLGEIDDAKYFRDKLLQAMTIPKSYFGQEDMNMSRLSLSAQDIKFARVIDRIQKSFANALREIARRHLILRGVPEEDFEDLTIIMTPSSDWRELARSEIMDSRFTRAGNANALQILPPKRILVDILKYSQQEAEDIQREMDEFLINKAKLEARAQMEAQSQPSLVSSPAGGLSGFGELLGGTGYQTPPGGLPSSMGGLSPTTQTPQVEIPPQVLPPPTAGLPSEREVELLFHEPQSESGESTPEIPDFETSFIDREEKDRGEA